MPARSLIKLFSLIAFLACQAELEFSNLGNEYPNNSTIYYEAITFETSLDCGTDNSSCCDGNEFGNWNDENGSLVPMKGSRTCLYATGGVEVVHLNREKNCTPPTSGVWRCDVPDVSGKMQSLYIYISNDISHGEISSHIENFPTYILHRNPR